MGRLASQLGTTIEVDPDYYDEKEFSKQVFGNLEQDLTTLKELVGLA